MRHTAPVLAAWLLALPAAAALADDGVATPGPAAKAVIGTTGYVSPEPAFALTLAFGEAAMGGVGQCGVPSDRASSRCKLRLAEGGPSVMNTGYLSPAVGVRFHFRF